MMSLYLQAASQLLPCCGWCSPDAMKMVYEILDVWQEYESIELLTFCLLGCLDSPTVKLKFLYLCLCNTSDLQSCTNRIYIKIFTCNFNPHINNPTDNYLSQFLCALSSIDDLNVTPHVNKTTVVLTRLGPWALQADGSHGGVISDGCHCPLYQQIRQYAVRSQSRSNISNCEMLPKYGLSCRNPWRLESDRRDMNITQKLWDGTIGLHSWTGSTHQPVNLICQYGPILYVTITQ